MHIYLQIQDWENHKTRTFFRNNACGLQNDYITFFKRITLMSQTNLERKLGLNVLCGSRGKFSFAFKVERTRQSESILVKDTRVTLQKIERLAVACRGEISRILLLRQIIWGFRCFRCAFCLLAKAQRTLRAQCGFDVHGISDMELEHAAQRKTAPNDIKQILRPCVGLGLIQLIDCESVEMQRAQDWSKINVFKCKDTF